MNRLIYLFDVGRSITGTPNYRQQTNVRLNGLKQFDETQMSKWNTISQSGMSRV